LFIGGFSAVFILLGLSATTIGQLVFDNQLLLTRLSGALVLGMGLFVLGSLVLHTPGLYRDARFHPDLGRCGAAAPGVAGIAFGFGWSPCIGPVLGSILTIAATQGRAWAGGTLLAAYSLGLGVPFLISGLIFGRLTGVFRWLKQHLVAVTAISGGSLVFFGVLLVFNRLVWVTTQLQTLLRGVGLDRLIELG
jgi:cytochrome c-type biogenesis protein